MAQKKGRIKDPDKKKEEKQKKEVKKRPDAEERGPKQIIRVAGTDLDGEKAVVRSLRKIKGVGYNFSNAICLSAGIDPSTKLVSLNESEIKKLESAIKTPTGTPKFLLNRQRDMATGDDVHLTSSDLDIAKRFDVQRHVDLKTYRGWRHMFGQPVRGQRTRSTFRVSGKAVGVVRKNIQQQKSFAKKGKK